MSVIYRDHLHRWSSDLGAMYIEAARASFGEPGAWGAAFLARVIAQHIARAEDVDDAYCRSAARLYEQSGHSLDRSRIGARLGRKLVAAARAWNATT